MCTYLSLFYNQAKNPLRVYAFIKAILISLPS